MGLIVLNFSRPLTPAQQAEIESMTGLPVERVIDVPVQLDLRQPFGPQVLLLASAAGLSHREWQTLTLVANLPELAGAAAALLMELHARMGRFPTVLHLYPETNGPTTDYVLAGLENLEAQRSLARRRLWPFSEEMP